MNRRGTGNKSDSFGDPDGEPRVRRRSRKSRRWPVIWTVGLILFLAVLVVGGTFLYRALISGTDEPVTMVVERGDSLSTVSGKLEDSGAIGSATIFEIRARVQGSGTGIKPGEYRIEPGDSNGEILGAMIEGGEEAVSEVSVPEGLTLAQTADLVAEKSGISEDEFSQAAGRTDYGYDFLEGEDVQNTEGFLFPKVYEFPQGASAPQMVGRMLEQYDAETGDLDFTEAGDSLDLNEHQVVTIASLIEREAANDEERARISSVIHNRLQDDMPLQIDATVQYALGEQKENLSLQDLEVDSPYNTYEREDLPPGPIASPGLLSIQAALNPADTDYRYYVLDRDGESHTFTQGYQKFLDAKEKAGR